MQIVGTGNCFVDFLTDCCPSVKYNFAYMYYSVEHCAYLLWNKLRLTLVRLTAVRLTVTYSDIVPWNFTSSTTTAFSYIRPTFLHWLHLAESVKQWRGIWLSVHEYACPIGILTVTHQGAACDMASIHFGLTIRKTNILVWRCCILGQSD